MDKRLIHSVIKLTVNPDSSVERITKEDRYGLFEGETKIHEVSETAPLSIDDLKAFTPDAAKLLAQISDWENNGLPGMRKQKAAKEVSPVQLRKALLTKDKKLVRQLGDALAADPEGQVEFEYGLTIPRTAPWLEKAMTRIGMTPGQIDELFVLARSFQ
jgi:hypothetical protein